MNGQPDQQTNQQPGVPGPSPQGAPPPPAQQSQGQGIASPHPSNQQPTGGAQQQTPAPVPNQQTSSPTPPPQSGSVGTSGSLPAETQAPPADTQDKPAAEKTSDAKSGSKGPSKKETDYRQRSERFRKEREIIRAREVDTDMSKRLGALAVPFIFLAILTLIVVFIFIPFSTEIVETRDNTRELLNDIERNENKIEQLMSIDLTTLDKHLEVTSTVVRDVMDVSEMAIEVERIALKHDLEPNSQTASNTEDVVVAASTLDTEWVPSYADVVSGPFNYSGKFANVTAFLRDLRQNSKTILSLGQIKMNRGTSGSEDDLEANDDDYWTVSLLISGYTAEPVQSADVADPVRTDIDMVILQEIYSRAGVEFQAEVSEEEATTDEGQGSGESTDTQSETTSETE